MEHDSRRRQENQSQRTRSRADNDRDERQFSDDRFGSEHASRERYANPQRESRVERDPDDRYSHGSRTFDSPYGSTEDTAGRRNFGGHERDYGGSDAGYGARHGYEDQRYLRQGRSSFSLDWPEQGAEPRYSDDPYHARNRDTGERHSSREAGGWRGDQNRTTTAEQRARGFTPRFERDDYRAGADRNFGSRYPYSSGGQERETERDRDEDQSHHRGYYSRSHKPLAYRGGSGHLFTESWTFVGPFTGRGPKGWKRSDQHIVEEASQRLERDGDVDATDIEVLSDGSVITLRGTVPDRATKRRAEEAVESVYGVRDVMNELRVAPQGDEQRSPSPQPGTQRKPRGSQAAQPSAAATRSTGGGAAQPESSAEDKSTH